MKLYDLTVPLDEGLLVYPGDPEFHRDLVAPSGRQTPVTARLGLGSHTGTHVDAAAHIIRGGWTVDQIDPGALVGPCALRQIIAAGEITRKRLEEFSWLGIQRVLLRTRNSGARPTSPSDLKSQAWLSPAAAEFLVERGVLLVGIDALSVDGPRAPDYPTHAALLKRGVVIVENLDLSAPPADDNYVLCCAPLRIVGGDGAPARVFLWK